VTYPQGAPDPGSETDSDPDSSDADARIALSVVDGQPPPDAPAALVSALAGVQKIMTTLGALVNDGAPMPAGDTHWGPFLVKETVGRGRFGIVYRAFDPVMAREVAVKLYADGELPAEPRLMARVRHPNVVTIHGAAIHDGRAGIWMELLAGRTLAARLEADGPLPEDAVARIGVELCRALEAVHGAGLVHQDVKPRNVMEQPDGRIVLMDFGAGLPAPRDGASPCALSGTPLYMAPEVVLGRPPSPRSDVYSLGVLLYQLLTGTYPAYAADWKELSALHARRVIDVRKVQEALRGLRPDLARPLACALAQALAGERERHASARELRAALESALRRRTVWAQRQWPLAGAAAFAAVLACAVGFDHLSAARRAPTATALRRLSWDYGLAADPARSPDGRWIAYASDRAGAGDLDLWIQRIGSSVPVRLTTDPADDSQPSFSPDGEHIAFRSERDGGGVYVMAASGGEARRIATDAHAPRYSPDGRWIAVLGRSTTFVSLIPTSGAPPVVLPLAAPESDDTVVWSPDSTRVLFIGVGTHADADWWVVRVDPEGHGPRIVRTGLFDVVRRLGGDPLLFCPAPGQWNGTRVLFQARIGDATNLWEIELDPRSFKVVGEPSRVTVSVDEQSQPTMGPDGAVLFATHTVTPALWELPLGPDGLANGAPRPITSSVEVVGSHAISHDGRVIAFSTRLGNRIGIAVRDMATGIELMPGRAGPASLERVPLLSADGSRVMYEAVVGGQSQVQIVPRGGGAVEVVCRPCGPATDWSADGRYVILQHDTTQRAWLGVLDRRTGRESVVLQAADRAIYRGHFSPDERWLTFHTAPISGSPTEFVAPFHGAQPVDRREWIAVSSGATLTDAPRWSAEGTLLYYVSDRDGFRCLWAQPLEPATKQPVGDPRALLHMHRRKTSIGNVDIRGIDVTVGGGRLVFNVAESQGNIWLAEPR
jgi:Tol biopolymer transport system component